MPQSIMDINYVNVKGTALETFATFSSQKLQLPEGGKLCFGELCYSAPDLDMCAALSAKTETPSVDAPMSSPLVFGGAFLLFALGIRALLRATGLRKLW